MLEDEDDGEAEKEAEEDDEQGVHGRGCEVYFYGFYSKFSRFYYLVVFDGGGAGEFVDEADAAAVDAEVDDVAQVVEGVVEVLFCVEGAQEGEDGV